MQRATFIWECKPELLFVKSFLEELLKFSVYYRDMTKQVVTWKKNEEDQEFDSALEAIAKRKKKQKNRSLAKKQKSKFESLG